MNDLSLLIFLWHILCFLLKQQPRKELHPTRKRVILDGSPIEIRAMGPKDP
jgi:hypothetical protein